MASRLKALATRLNNPADTSAAWKFASLLLCMEVVACAAILQRVSCESPELPTHSMSQMPKDLSRERAACGCRYRNRLGGVHATSPAICQGSKPASSAPDAMELSSSVARIRATCCKPSTLQGERDYSQIKGQTGPLVYPAGFLYVYTVLAWLTKGGQIALGQIIFTMLYLINQCLVMSLYIHSQVGPRFA